MSNDLVEIISAFFTSKASHDDKKKRKVIEETLLMMASLGLLALLKAHSKQVQTLVRGLFDGSLSSGQFRSQFTQALKDNANNAYAAGAGRPLTVDDKKFVKQWVKEQTSHISSFIADSEKGAPIAAPLSRAVLWASALGALGSMAIMRTNPDALGTWHYGDTVKHCETCGFLDGKTLPLKEFLKHGWIPQQPGSATLSCGGWACKCTVKDATGKILLPVHLRE